MRLGHQDKSEQTRYQNLVGLCQKDTVANVMELTLAKAERV